MDTFSDFCSKLLRENDDRNVTTGIDRGVRSGFCKYNPAIRKFALSSPRNMEVVIAFVFFTMQKGWHEVLEYFPPFMEWYLTKGEKLGFRYSNDEVFHKLVNRFGPLKHQTTGETLDSYLKILHNNINSIYKFVVDNQDDELAVYLYINKMPGLAMAKSAFVVQLILGKMGCLDSINQKVYGSMLPDKLKGTSIATSEKTGLITPAGQRNLDLYLKALNILGKDMHSQLLWDDWCDIVEKKLLYSAEKSELDNNKIKITLPDGNVTYIEPYESDEKNRDTMEKAKASLSGSDGQTVSRQHADLITKYGESTYFDTLYDVIINESLSNELVYLKRYLQMSDQDKAIQRAHSNSWLIDDFLDGYIDIELPEDFHGLEHDEKVEWLQKNHLDTVIEFSEYISQNRDYMSSSEQELYDIADYRGFVRNKWLLHFSDSAFNIWNQQKFAYGIAHHDYNRLGLSTHWNDSAKKWGGFNFAYDVETDAVKRYAFNRGGPKYGKEAILFKGDGVKIWHHGDEEPQVIFDGAATRTPLIYVEFNDSEWVINSTITGQKLIGSDDIEEIAYWLDRNYAQYQKHLEPKRKIAR